MEFFSSTCSFDSLKSRFQPCWNSPCLHLFCTSFSPFNILISYFEFLVCQFQYLHHLWVCFSFFFFSCALTHFFFLFLGRLIIFVCMLHIGYKRRVGTSDYVIPLPYPPPQRSSSAGCNEALSWVGAVIVLVKLSPPLECPCPLGVALLDLGLKAWPVSVSPSHSSSVLQWFGG